MEGPYITLKGFVLMEKRDFYSLSRRAVIQTSGTLDRLLG